MVRTSSMVRFSIVLAASLAAAAAPAVADAARRDDAGAASKKGTAEVSADAEIAGVVSAANQGEIAVARAVVERVESADVRAFAERMAAEHGASDVALTNLMETLGIEPVESAESAMIEQQAADEISRLADLQGDELDRAYMDGQIAAHAAMLAALQTMLIPSAESDELRAFLEALVPVVTDHLEQARGIRAGLEVETAPES